MSAAAVARMMEILARFAAAPKAGFEQTAKAIQDAQGNLKPLNEVLAILIQRYPKLRTSGVYLQNFFKMISGQQGTIQARRAFQNFVNQFELYQNVLRNTRGDQREFTRSLRAMEQSTGVKWAQFVNQLRALALELGSAVIPGLLALGRPLLRAVKWFEGLSDETKRTIGYIAGITAGLTLLGGTLLTVVGSLASMAIALRLFFIMRPLTTMIRDGAAASEGLSGGLRILGGEAGFATARFALLTGGIGALVGAMVLFPHQASAMIHGLSQINGILTALLALPVVLYFTRAGLAILQHELQWLRWLLRL